METQSIPPWLCLQLPHDSPTTALLSSLTLNVYAHHIPEDCSRVLGVFIKAVWGA